ncbi:MAG TPA: fumarylacetoacetate hydrolase family protein [Vicinamibacterales bacterium]|jgi:2-keto-4-pentenoate hydratase/2-oxohepta-3-ene-1,7-dioic acid hydratase in catechol pathway|nr:fumarylacetoacetate hydrolase family protein [Vicinamibacterales bacterium]
MLRHLALVGLVAVSAVTFPEAQSGSATPFKLGTFAQGSRTFVGLVLNDATAVDLSKAEPSLPSDMKVLLQQYDSLRAKLGSIASSAAGTRPAHAYDIKSLKTLPPVMPQNILNAAVNYTEHAKEMIGISTSGFDGNAAPPKEGIPGIWQRKPGDTRHNPYVFPKMVGAVVGNGDAIRLPAGRDQVDWECELSVVVGREADHVPVDRAHDYIVGFTLQNDVSDRAGRGDGRHGSDWFMGKSHPTFAPLGPYIVPKEFVADPQKLAIKFTLSGKVMQDSSTDRMTHTVYEMLSYVSHIMTLKPGDIVATGSPAGVGAARKIFMKPGDLSVCTIEGIGTLTNPVVGPGS